jgi:hypothetical protein
MLSFNLPVCKSRLKTGAIALGEAKHKHLLNSKFRRIKNA